MGGLAQLGEHLLCKQGVNGSIPLSSTNTLMLSLVVSRKCLVRLKVAWLNTYDLRLTTVSLFFNKMEEVKR